MPSIVLGRDQNLSVDGTVLDGVREIDISVDLKTQDVTAWNHAWCSTLATHADVTIAFKVLWSESYSTIGAKLNQHPPQPLTVAITNAGSAKFLLTNVKIGLPIDGVMAWDVTMKLWSYSDA